MQTPGRRAKGHESLNVKPISYHISLACSFLFVYTLPTMRNDVQLPPPDLVLQAAREQEPQRILNDYTEAIHELRNKNFTFREIAVWLGRFGFEVDHNAVWRAYAKTVGDFQAVVEAKDDERLEREEAFRDAELNGGITTVPPAAAKSAPTKSQPRKARKQKRSA